MAQQRWQQRPRSLQQRAPRQHSMRHCRANTHLRARLIAPSRKARLLTLQQSCLAGSGSSALLHAAATNCVYCLYLEPTLW